MVSLKKTSKTRDNVNILRSDHSYPWRDGQPKYRNRNIERFSAGTKTSAQSGNTVTRLNNYKTLTSG